MLEATNAVAAIEDRQHVSAWSKLIMSAWEATVRAEGTLVNHKLLSSRPIVSH